jgi:hypothetical protein
MKGKRERWERRGVASVLTGGGAVDPREPGKWVANGHHCDDSDASAPSDPSSWKRLVAQAPVAWVWVAWVWVARLRAPATSSLVAARNWRRRVFHSGEILRKNASVRVGTANLDAAFAGYVTRQTCLNVGG